MRRPRCVHTRPDAQARPLRNPCQRCDSIRPCGNALRLEGRGRLTDIMRSAEKNRHGSRELRVAFESYGDRLPRPLRKPTVPQAFAHRRRVAEVHEQGQPALSCASVRFRPQGTRRTGQNMWFRYHREPPVSAPASESDHPASNYRPLLRTTSRYGRHPGPPKTEPSSSSIRWKQSIVTQASANASCAWSRTE